MPESNDLKRQQIQLLVLMYLSYAVTMLLKISVVFVSPALIDDPNLGMTKAQFGSIMAAGSLGGVLGKFFFGWLADKIGGKIAFLISLVLISAGILLFGMSSHVVVFIITYFTVNFAKSAGWASLAKLIANWYQPSLYGRVWGLISTSSRTGAIIASLVLGSLLYILHWNEVLWCAGAFGCITVSLWLFSVQEKPPTELPKIVPGDSTEDGAEEVEEKKDEAHHLAEANLLEALLAFVTSRRVWLIVISMFGLTIMADFLNFVPILAKETLKLSSAKASMTTSAFPIGAFVSLLVGGWVYDKVSSRSVTKLMGASIFISLLCLGSMLYLSFCDYSETVKVTVFFASLFLYGFAIAPAYYLPMSIFSIKFGGKHSGILISLLDSGGFTASMLFAILAGIIADQVFGWAKVLVLLMIINFLTLIFLVWFLRGEAKVDEGIA